MNRYLLLLVLLVASPVYASEASYFTGFIDWFSGQANDLHNLFTNSVPSAAQRFAAWAIEFCLYVKLYIFYQSAVFAFGIAQQFANDLHLSAFLAAAVSGLPDNVKAVANMWGLPDCVNFIVHCWLTRFVMNFMGW